MLILRRQYTSSSIKHIDKTPATIMKKKNLKEMALVLNTNKNFYYRKKYEKRNQLKKQFHAKFI